MNIRTFFWLELWLGLLAGCTPLIKPDPEPMVVTLRDEFRGESSLFDMTSQPGNKSYFDGDNLYLTADSGSGWVYSTASYLLPGDTVTVRLKNVSTDFCLEMSPFVEPKARNGFYLNDFIARFYVYDQLHRLYVEIKVGGIMLVRQDVTKEFLDDSCAIRVRFTSDSLFYDYQKETWKNALAISHSFSGAWYFALSSAARHGVSIVDYFEITGPAQNFMPPDSSVHNEPDSSGSATLVWKPNPEPDVVGYKAEALIVNATDTLIIFTSGANTTATFSTGLTKGDTVKFRVAAQDTAGNWSKWTDPDTVKAVIK